MMILVRSVIKKQSLRLNPGYALSIALVLQKCHYIFCSLGEQIAQILYATGLIEAWGSGTMKMTKECMKAGLPEPVFEEYAGGMQVTFSKDIFSDENLQKMGLNPRQIKGILYLKKYGEINNQQYQKIAGAVKRTASRDLTELSEKKIITKSGSTGKGTAYVLAGYKATKQESNKDSLDDKLQKLDKELEVFDQDEELQLQLSKEVFLNILNTWLSDLIKEVVPVIQKFNRYFINPEHFVHLPNPIGGLRFVDERPAEIVKKLKEESIKGIAQFNPRMRDADITISTYYGSFKRAGLDTFGCNYAIEIKLSSDWYEVFMDDEVMKRNQHLQYKRQYHKPLTKPEAKALALKFGEVIYQHINDAVQQISQKKLKEE